jgi:glycosyltransferase involved in cell wall biosynthesis
MRWKLSTHHFVRQIAAELSSATRYYDRLVQWAPHTSDRGELLEAIDCPRKETIEAGQELPDLSEEREQRYAVLLYGNFNYDFDIQQLLMQIKPRLSRTSRVLAVCYNPYLRWLLVLAHRLGLREGDVPTTFATRAVLTNIARLSGFEIVRERPAVYFPFALFGIGTLLDRLISALPLVRNFALIDILFLRPIAPCRGRPSLSIVISARNERGNIEPALQRLPDFGGARIEILFVEGHSNDGTWEEIHRVIEKFAGRLDCKAFQQTGVGKADAVRLGFSHATGDVLTILDADLTMPPELLPRFYDAYCRGDADLINGSRLVYPMEGKAMRALNVLGNLFFTKPLGWIMSARLTDVLCGTKLFARSDYERFRRWRDDFGDFDPFGDFELLFPAAVLGLGIIDVPIRYRDRTYGTTQIRRFRHGWELLKMTAIAVLRLKVARLRAVTILERGPWSARARRLLVSLGAVLVRSRRRSASSPPRPRESGASASKQLDIDEASELGREPGQRGIDGSRERECKARQQRPGLEPTRQEVAKWRMRAVALEPEPRVQPLEQRTIPLEHDPGERSIRGQRKAPASAMWWKTFSIRIARSAPSPNGIRVASMTRSMPG